MPKSVNTADEYDFVDHEDAALSPEALDEIREWLQPTDYLADSGEFRRHLSSQAPGTGLWLCETDEYQKWHDSPDHGSLWIKGVPGAGKSVMAASLIQHLRSTEDCPVLFFFFRNIVAANFSPRALIQDWLAQLLPYSPKLQFALQSRLGTQLAETSDNDLIDIFLDGVSCVPKLYCVGDALDEMTTENRPFLDKLNGLATYRPRSLKLLMTSRPKQYLQSALRDSSIVHISLQQQLVDVDISSYLHHRFDNTPKSKSQEKIKQQVIDMVAARSEGLFLYAKLTMDQVEPTLIANDPLDLHALEESLPVGLEQTYTRMLAKQREEFGVSTDAQVLILEAVTHASRPLRLNELASLMKCVCPQVNAPAGFKVLITNSCGPLLEILEDETLQVIHHSFTEYLRGDTRNALKDDAPSEFPIINSDKAHKRMALNCLEYLQSGSLLLEDELSGALAMDPSITYILPQHMFDHYEVHHRRPSLGLKEEKDPFSYRQARLLHPFLSYAVENWTYHASRYDVQDEELFTAVSDFPKPDGIAFLRWLGLQWGSTSKTRGSTQGIPTVLHIAAFAGLSELVLNLIQQGSSVSALDAQERTPLHWAAANGHAKIVSLLIQHGSEPDAADGCGIKPIHLAAKKNHVSIVTLLLEAGVEPETIKTKNSHAGYPCCGQRSTIGECSLLYASQGGHTETLIAMIPFCKPHVLEKLLCLSCHYGRPDAVLAILDKSDVSADATYRNGTALYFACQSTNVKCVKALIDRGADVLKTSDQAWSIGTHQRLGETEKMKAPLHRLVMGWREDNDSDCCAILEMLIKAGADLEQLDVNGCTALLLAVGGSVAHVRGYCQSAAIKSLLKAGADVKKEYHGLTVLQLALDEDADEETVRLLLEHGSDPNERGSKGKTALHCVNIAPSRQKRVHGDKSPAIVQLLLERGADPNIRSKDGVSPVVRAMTKNNFEVLKLLLSRCNEDSVKKQCWLQLCSVYKIDVFTKCFDFMLATGIDINTRGKDGRTLYLRCLENEDKLSILRKNGAKTDVVDNEGRNSLHIRCQTGRFTRQELEKFIAEGADPLRKSNNGDTLLHLAAHNSYKPEHGDHIRWLLNLGIQVNAVNAQGQTAVHVAQTKNNTGSKSTYGYDGNRRDHAGRCSNGSEIIHFVHTVNANNEVDFEIRDKSGLTALHMAAMRSELELLRLIEAGADFNALTADSQNVLHLASRARRPDIVAQILQDPQALDINQEDKHGRTPLHYAASSGEPESVSFLLEHGADIHVVDSHRYTPLHAAAQSRLEQDIWNGNIPGLDQERLRESREDPFRPRLSPKVYHRRPWYQDRYEDTPHPQLRKRSVPGVATVVKILLDAGADIAAVDKDNFTALDVALHVDCAEFVEVFFKNDELFARATSNLEVNEETNKKAERIRQLMKTQMALMRQSSLLDILRQDQAAFDQVRKAPAEYMNLLMYEDAARLINEEFEADPHDPRHYETLRELMKPGHLEVVELVPNLILHFSSNEGVKEILESERKARNLNLFYPIFNSLQFACRERRPNMQLLKLLVEKLRVDVNVHSAIVERHTGHSYVLESNMVPGPTALHTLAAADSYWQVMAMEYLIDQGADVNAMDERGQSPLHVAARATGYMEASTYGLWRLSALRVLLDNGADVNLIDKEGMSALHRASGSPDAMRLLLSRGADPAAGETNALFLAIGDQNLTGMEILLDHGLSLNSVDKTRHSRKVHYKLKESRTVYPLLCTAFEPGLNMQVGPSMPLLRCLVERGADLYLPLNDHETLIHFLFEWPQYHVSETLLEEPCASRIDFERRDQRGRTVLIASCDWRDGWCGEYSMRQDPNTVGYPLRILDRGVDATAVDNDGRTALHHLLNNTEIPEHVLLQFLDRKEVVPLLFKKDGDGFLPFHYALRLHRHNVCELLLSKGANLLEPDPNGLTALHYIAAQCLVKATDRLSAGTADIKRRKEHRDRGLALWQRFISEGGSINVTDNAGNTPLHAYFLSPAIVLMDQDEQIGAGNLGACHLVNYERFFPADSGVDIFAVNDEGETVLHMISKREHVGYVEEMHDTALFKFMMNKGLDPLREDAKGRSALDVASAVEKTDIVGLFGRKCARLNVPCIGAGQQKYKFKSVSFEEESAVVKTPKEPIKTVELVVPVPPVTTIPPEPTNVSTVIASKFVAALEVTDLRYSLSCYGNVLEHIPQRLGQSEALDASVKALVSAFPYHYTRQLPPDALSNYIDALTALRLCIGREDNRLAPETLSAIYIIMICQNWRDTFELRLLETLFVPLILEAMVNPAVVMESWFMLVDSCIPRASCGRSEGFRVPSLEAQQLVRMPIFFYKPMQFVEDIKSTYHYLRIDQPRVRQHLSELNHDVVSSSEEMRANHMKLFHKYQVVYGVLLTVAAGLNSLLRTLYPHDQTLIDQAITFTNELIFLAQHASQYRPLGAGYIPPCLASVTVGNNGRLAGSANWATEHDDAISIGFPSDQLDGAGSVVEIVA
ncbi:hypothetical protein FDECE_10369 [Fusarium decemcellulare]|nr:hypothetical protein FDECE_10369 [Fusarium decemcellulare]